MELEGYEGHFGELGDYTVGFETYTADADLAELFGVCPTTVASARTGVSCSRASSSSRRRRRHVIEAGEAYYVPPGHLPYLYAGTEVIEFSPTQQLHETLAVIEKNMAAESS